MGPTFDIVRIVRPFAVRKSAFCACTSTSTLVMDHIIALSTRACRICGNFADYAALKSGPILASSHTQLAGKLQVHADYLLDEQKAALVAGSSTIVGLVGRGWHQP